MKITKTTSQADFLASGTHSLDNPLYRIQQGSTRYYHRVLNGEVTLYSSGTTAVADGYVETAQEKKALSDWKLKMMLQGKNPTAYMMYRADYGTLMHLLWGHYLMGRDIPLDEVHFAAYLRDMDEVSFSYQRLEELVNNDAHELRRDLLAFASWVREYEVTPLALELMVASDTHLIGTPLDLLCEMSIWVKGFHGELYKSGKQKGEPKETKKKVRVKALVDFKSGRSGHYPKHAVQLQITKTCFEESFPNTKIDKLFNLSPTDWRDTPSCKMTDQTDHICVEELPEILITAKKRHLRKNPVIKVWEGSLSLNSEGGSFKKVPLREYLKSQNQKVNG